MVTRKQLVEGMVPKIVGDKHFHAIRGITLDQLNSLINMVLDARNKTFKELTDGGQRTTQNPS